MEGAARLGRAARQMSPCFKQQIEGESCSCVSEQEGQGWGLALRSAGQAARGKSSGWAPEGSLLRARACGVQCGLGGRFPADTPSLPERFQA